MIYSNSKNVSSKTLSAEIVSLKDRIVGHQSTIDSLRRSLKSLESAITKQKNDYENIISEKDAIIKELKNQLAHMAAVAGHDGTNTGTPTSSTPINKKKIIPNSRRNSGKAKGGQQGHKKHTLESFNDTEINDTILHGVDTESESCEKCCGKLSDTGETIEKDEFDIEVKVIKRRHLYNIYQCNNCGKVVRQQINKMHKEKNQYGSNLQALAISLMSTGNVAMNKVRMMINGMTNGVMNPSEGFICKLYKRASEGLINFRNDLRKLMLTRSLLYWDDTVVMIQTERACMRFYGDKSISYYTAHDEKGMNGLIDDNILAVLTKDTTVMHDHNKVNYNGQFSFENIECNQHLQRDLQKISDDNPTHTWSGKLKELISTTINARKDLIASGLNSFDEDAINNFRNKVKELLILGDKENVESSNKYAAPFEKVVIKRINSYMSNYFRWVEDFSLPTTDNLSERGLRSIKSHMKISGQFDSEKTAKYYATVKTYVETCRKNNINEIVALSRLCNGNPYTVKEIFA